jgi:hypothetical protein
VPEIKLCATCQHRTSSIASSRTVRCGHTGSNQTAVDAWFDENWVRMDGKGDQSLESGVERIERSCPGHTERKIYRGWIVVQPTQAKPGTSGIIGGIAVVVGSGLTYKEATELVARRSSGCLMMPSRNGTDPEHPLTSARYSGDPKLGEMVRYDLHTCVVFDPVAEANVAAAEFDAVFGAEEP